MTRLRDALGWLLPARDKVLPARESKASATARVVAWETLGQPVWSPRDYRTFAVEGFAQNPIVYRSVRMIAEAAATIPLLLYEGANEIESHPLLDLMARPSLDHTGTDFLEAWYGYLLVSGNAYAEAVAVGGEVREIHALRPDRMKVLPGPDGWPEGYEYTAAGGSVRLVGEVAGLAGGEQRESLAGGEQRESLAGGEQRESFAGGEQGTRGVRRVLHVKLFHPTNDHYGMSPIEAAAVAIDTHNTAAQWNKALLDNAARPSGALVYASRDGHLTDEQFGRLKAELEAGFQGARNAGRPMLLEGGLDWKPLSMSPKDMDFVEAKNAAAREIALALGVPPMLLGIPGDNTYSNYQEASRSFWRQTVLPLVNRTAKALSGWLGPAYGGGLDLRPDLDQIEALAPEREALWTRLGKAEFLSDDEKRAATGYGPKAEENAGGGGAVKFNPYHDELGRFTTGDGGGGGDTAIVPVAFRPRGGGGKPPPSPPPPAKPAQPHTPGLPPGAGGQAQPTPPKPSEQRLEDILKPGGKDIGERLGGAKERIRTIEKTEFDTLRSKLLDGSKEVPTPTEYRGKWYERPDGTRFGVRESTESGTTIDVINGGKSGLENGYRIHQK